MTTARHRRSRWSSRRLRAALSLGVALSAGSVGTHAYWTGSATLAGATFTSGSIDLKVNNLDAAVAFTTINLSGMVPGSTTAGVLIVKNAGTVGLQYTASSTATNADGKGLSGALVVKVSGDAATTGAPPAKTCAGAPLVGTGTNLTGAVVGTARSLASGASETLCFQVALPATAPSALQGATTTATVTFSAQSVLR